MKNIIIKICIISISSLIVLSCNKEEVNNNTLNDGLVAYYPFDGNVDDYSGNSFNLIGFTGHNFGSGIVAQSLTFDGITDFLEFPDTVRFQPLKSSTLSFWIKTNQTSRFDLFTQRTGSFSPSDFNYGLIFNMADPASLDVRCPGYNSGTEFSTNLRLDSLSWTNIIIIKNTNDSSTVLYKNGIDVINHKGMDTDYEIQGKLLLGTNQNKNAFFRGMIDEIRIYNRAISNNEISLINKP